MLLFGAQLFGESEVCCGPGGEPLKCGQFPAAYNAPAAIVLKDSCGQCRSNGYVTASYLYWYVDQEGMDIANSFAFDPITFPNDPVVETAQTIVLSQPFKYNSGFKVGLGTDFDEWTVYGQYTWMRTQTSITQHAPVPVPAVPLGGEGVWVPNDWYQQIFPLDQYLFGNQITSKWHLRLDLADLVMGRPYYLGKSLTINPFAGVRAAWIRQNLSISTSTPAGDVELSSSPAVSNNSSHSWGVGPRIGFDAYCLLSQGFRLQADMATSLLFTRYTKVKHSENVVVLADAARLPSISIALSNYNCLRPILECGLGLGWGTYLGCKSYHIDFSANYDFSLFWEQNMMRKLANLAVSATGSSAADLHMHGLTLTGRFDF